MERAVLEFVAVVRRAGVCISPAEAIDAVRAACAIGPSRRDDLRTALSATLAKDHGAAAKVRACFERFFSQDGGSPQDLFARLLARGFTPEELSSLRVVLEAQTQASPAGGLFRAITQGEAAVAHLLDGAQRALELPRQAEPGQLGFWTMRLLAAARVPRAETDLAGIRSALRGALGTRGDALADAVLEALREVSGLARAQLTRALIDAEVAPFEERPFASLTPHEREQMEEAVRALATRLLGRAAVRARHDKRGRLDARRTLRGALRTGFLPMRLFYRKRSRRRPTLVVLCDVSDSMLASARFMLQLVHALQAYFRDARSFVFVSDVAEATEVFRTEPARRAIELAYRGGIVSVADNSNYAHVFSLFLERHADALGPHSTLLLLGDGRSNHLSAGEGTFAQLAERVKRVLWFTPEPEGRWAGGDSALSLYAPHVDELLPVHDLKSLQHAARTLVRR